MHGRANWLAWSSRDAREYGVPASREAAWSFSLSPSQRQQPGLVYSTSLLFDFEASPAAAAAQRARRLGRRPHGARREAARGSADSAAAIGSARLLYLLCSAAGYCRRGRSVGRAVSGDGMTRGGAGQVGGMGGCSSAGRAHNPNAPSADMGCIWAKCGLVGLRATLGPVSIRRSTSNSSSPPSLGDGRQVASRKAAIPPTSVPTRTGSKMPSLSRKSLEIDPDPLISGPLVCPLASGTRPPSLPSTHASTQPPMV
jgi:hypothetical protein